MNFDFLKISYVMASIFFILFLRVLVLLIQLLEETFRIIGMVVGWGNFFNLDYYLLPMIAIFIGGSIGILIAKVEMTQMPELVAAMHSCRFSCVFIAIVSLSIRWLWNCQI